MGRQHKGMDRPGVRQVPEGSGEQRQMEETGCVNGQVKVKKSTAKVKSERNTSNQIPSLSHYLQEHITMFEVIWGEKKKK